MTDPAFAAAASLIRASVNHAEPGQCEAGLEFDDLEAVIWAAMGEDRAQLMYQDLDAMQTWMTPEQYRNIESLVWANIARKARDARHWVTVSLV